MSIARCHTLGSLVTLLVFALTGCNGDDSAEVSGTEEPRQRRAIRGARRRNTIK